MSNDLQIKENIVVSLAYTLTVDGSTEDSAGADSPLVYLQGHGNLISGLERELEGMKVGEKKSVLIQPEDGYGRFDPEQVVDLERSLFGESYPVQVGGHVHLQDDANHHFEATIKAVTDSTVTVDLNHPLAGKELLFDVEIVDLREATEDEIQMGFIPPAGFSGGCGGSCSSCGGGCGH